MEDSYVLVTGGVGFIGSHTSIVLLEKGYNVLIIDNFSNTSTINIKGLQVLHSKLKSGNTELYKNSKLIILNVDLRNKEDLERVFKNHSINSVIHFAALKAVGESIEKPLLYYDNNIVGVLNLLEQVTLHRISKFIFSSSATVYGFQEPPFHEDKTMTGLGITNPYGRTKQMTEEILEDLHKSRSSNLSVIMLRYFNPIGAHHSGLLGEVPIGTPNNLFPYILDVAEGKRPEVSVYGGNWNTPDGTCLRDYIHVMDLAEGHYEALRYMEAMTDNSSYSLESKLFDVFNLGTGKPTSVLELIKTFEEVAKVKVPYSIISRRHGDVQSSYAMVSKAKTLLGWIATRSLEDMCQDGWNFRNPSKMEL
jgi:UDP-glucose 4-epimerase